MIARNVFEKMSVKERKEIKVRRSSLLLLRLIDSRSGNERSHDTLETKKIEGLVFTYRHRGDRSSICTLPDPEEQLSELM